MAREALTIATLNILSNIDNATIRYAWVKFGVPCKKEELYDCNRQRYAVKWLLTRADFERWLADHSSDHRVIRATRRAFGIGD
jgi:hypothetical protein